MPSTLPVVYLDIRIGDPAHHASLLEAYNATCTFVAQHAGEIGTDSVEKLEDWQKDLVKDLWKGDATAVSFNHPGEMKGGRIVFELFEECKKTAENFVAISQGFKISKTTRKPLHYANTPIHRLVPKFIFQGGDVTRFDGSGGESIYGPTFSDEKPGLKIPFERGTLGMANRGKNSNSSQFFVCLGDGEKLKGRYVAFGKVKEGWDVLELIEAVEVDGESPKEKVTVVACGVL